MNITCKKCRMISFAITKKAAEAEIKRFVDMYQALDDEGKKFWDGIGRNGERVPREMPTLANYSCLYCGGTDFEPSTDAESKRAYGCTINSAIYEGDTR